MHVDLRFSLVHYFLIPRYLLDLGYHNVLSFLLFSYLMSRFGMGLLYERQLLYPKARTEIALIDSQPREVIDEPPSVRKKLSKHFSGKSGLYMILWFQYV